GGLNSTCPNVASCTTLFMAKSPAFATKFDGFGSLRLDDENARLDNFANALQANPESSGVIMVYGSVEGEAAKRADRAISYLAGRGVAAPRLTPINGGCRAEFTLELWVVPRGAANPTPISDGAVTPCPPKKLTSLRPRSGRATYAGVVRGPDGQTIAGA